MFVNEITPGVAAIDFSSWPSDILNGQELPQGFAYRKTLDALGIEHDMVTASRTALLAGETRTVLQNVPQLLHQIGAIARYGAFLDRYYPGLTRDEIGKQLGAPAQRLRGLADDTPFVDIAAAVTEPFAKAANDPKELFVVIPGNTAWWLGEKELGERSRRIEAFVSRISGKE